MNKLTTLQRLGISQLLVNFRFHGNQWFESGIITFKYNEYGKYYIMRVKCYQREIMIQFQLKLCENIDCNYRYYCCYKPEDLIFTVEDDNEKVVES